MTSCLIALFCRVESCTCPGHSPKDIVKLFSLFKDTSTRVRVIAGMVIANFFDSNHLAQTLLHNKPSSPATQHTRQSCSRAEHKDDTEVTLKRNPTKCWLLHVNCTTWGPLPFTFQTPLGGSGDGLCF